MQKTFDGITYETVSDPSNEHGCSLCALRSKHTICTKANHDINCSQAQVYWTEVVSEKEVIVEVDGKKYKTIPEQAAYNCRGCSFWNEDDQSNDGCKSASEKYDCSYNECIFVPLEERKVIRISTGSYTLIPKGGCHNCAFQDEDCSEINNVYHCSENDCSFEKLPVPEGEVHEKDIVYLNEKDNDAKYWYGASTYYLSIVTDIGKLFGIDAYTSDDGSIQDSVLAAKVYELVTRLVHSNALLKSRIASLEVE